MLDSDVPFLQMYYWYQPVFPFRHRVLRHQAVLNVSQSLGLKAVAKRGSQRKEELKGDQDNMLTVSLEIENLNQVQLFQLFLVN